jgi:hypothetical protein
MKPLEEKIEVILKEYIRETLVEGKGQPLIRRAIRREKVQELLALIKAREEQIIEDYGDFRPIIETGRGIFKKREVGKTLRFYLLPHTQHREGDDKSDY